MDVRNLFCYEYQGSIFIIILGKDLSPLLSYQFTLFKYKQCVWRSDQHRLTISSLWISFSFIIHSNLMRASLVLFRERERERERDIEREREGGREGERERNPFKTKHSFWCTLFTYIPCSAINLHLFKYKQCFKGSDQHRLTFVPQCFFYLPFSLSLSLS